VDSKRLRKPDWAALLRYDEETRKLDLKNREIIRDPETITRLIESEAIRKDGSLSDTTLEMVKKMKVQLEKMRVGVPVRSRKSVDFKKALSGEQKWLIGRVARQPVISNGHMVLLGTKMKGMDAEVGSKSFKNGVQKSVAKLIQSKGYVEVFPDIWQLKDIGGLEVIWLVSKDESVMVSIQAMYYDLVMKRYPNCVWFGKSQKSALQARSRKSGYGLNNGVVAVVMPMLLAGILPEPKRRGDEKDQAV